MAGNSEKGILISLPIKQVRCY